MGIHGNERADKMAKAAAKRAIRNANLSESQLQARWVEDEADAVVNAMLAAMK